MDRLEESGECSDEDILDLIDEIVVNEGAATRLGLRKKEELRRDLFYSVRKLDVLQELIDDPSITEIMVNGHRDIFYERAGKLFRSGKSFASRERLEDVIQQIAGRCNRVVNEQSPIVDARLSDGARVNVVLPPVALNGPVLTIRRFPDRPLTMERLVRTGSLSAEAAGFLRDLVEAGYTVLVGGGTSTGKTTILNVLSSFIPQGERIVSIEDNAELQIRGVENLVRLETKSAILAGGTEITIRDLIRTALRMRPSRIIIGEVRGSEAADFLTCLNTGHAGSLGSAHANSVRDMIGRLETMVLMGADLPVPVIRRQIAAGVEILVHLERTASGKRQLVEIAEIEGLRRDEVQIRTLYARSRTGELAREGELLHTEKMEKLYERKNHEKKGA